MEVCLTSAMTFSYGMRVGPMTPITPDSAPVWYAAVTTVRRSRRAAWAYSRCPMW